MAQFDSLIIFSLLWSLLLTLLIHYTILLNTVIPGFFGVKKFREKKLDLKSFTSFNNLNLNVKITNSYSHLY